jgi:hypothetical protein
MEITKMYKVTKKFLSGILAGFVVTEETIVPFVEGKIYKSCVGKGEYIIIKSERV